MAIRVRHGSGEVQFSSMSDVRAALADRRLDPADQVWHPLSEAWRMLSDVVAEIPADGVAPPASASKPSTGVAAPASPSMSAARAPAGGPSTPASPSVPRPLPIFRRTKVVVAAGAAVVGVIVLVVVLLAGRGRRSDGGSTEGMGANGVCAKVPCSGHGTCVPLRGEPTCACDADYRAEGLNCVRQLQPASEQPYSGPARLRQAPAPDYSNYGMSQSDREAVERVRNPPPPPQQRCADTCAGCCDGERCLPGTSVAACGMGGRPCLPCGSGVPDPDTPFRHRCDGTCIVELRDGRPRGSYK